jgi:hypothetical protein
MTIGKQLRSVAAVSAFVAVALALAGCEGGKSTEVTAPPPDNGVGTSAGGLSAGSDSSSYSYADVQTATVRAERIRNLLANCTGPAAAVASVEAANMAKAEMALRAVTTTSSGTTRDQAVNAMLTQQAGAYQAAVDCGLVAPGVPDPGSWNATWDDISS